MRAIDSNIWCYALDSTVPQHRKANRAIEDALGNGVLVNTVIQLEVAHYLVKRLGPVAGREATDSLVAMPVTVDTVDPDLVFAALDQLARHSSVGVGGRDASILASMQRHGVTQLVTHDRTFRRVEWVEVLDPLER